MPYLYRDADVSRRFREVLRNSRGTMWGCVGDYFRIDDLDRRHPDQAFAGAAFKMYLIEAWM